MGKMAYGHEIGEKLAEHYGDHGGVADRYHYHCRDVHVQINALICLMTFKKMQKYRLITFKKMYIIKKNNKGVIIVLKRAIMNDLLLWKNKANRKPLILQGARQVGKTWIMKEFGKQNYNYVAYVNMDHNMHMMESFSKDFDVERIIEDISIETHTKIVPGETLIIFDEIQEIPLALSCLKYFCENAPQHHIIAAGSLLGVAMHKGISYPVGKVNILTMYPLSFVEFLEAVGEEKLSEYACRPGDDINQVFRDKYIGWLKKYYYIGGMPEAVMTYLEERNFDEVRMVQNTILQLYENDFSKHIDSKTELERTRMVWNSIPMQLAKENKKFFFGQIKKGARSATFEVSIQWLIDCGLVYKVYCVQKPGVPLKAYTDFSAYKLFMVDVGLLGAMSDLDAESILEGNRIFIEFKGAMAEQYVHQQIVSTTDYIPYYYSNVQSRNEIDFLIQIKSYVVPLEVKAEENLRSKSLKAYVDKFEPAYAFRLSMSDYRRQDWLTNIPLWNIDQFQLL